MRLMPDTHLLLWATGRSGQLSVAARQLIGDPENQVFFSAASIWEVAIKFGLGRPDFRIHPRMLRDDLLSHHYSELRVTGEHVVVVPNLPPVHRDPFDRLLIAQCTVEGITLLTSDTTIARYPGPIRQV